MIFFFWKIDDNIVKNDSAIFVLTIFSPSFIVFITSWGKGVFFLGASHFWILMFLNFGCEIDWIVGEPQPNVSARIN